MAKHSNMKRLIIASLIGLTAGCATQETEELPQITGAFKMVAVSINDGTKDSTLTDADQVKIYTPDYMMYVKINSDSSSLFGIGNYTETAGKDTVIEHILFRAANSTANTGNSTYTLLISKIDKGYKQYIPFIGEMNGKKYSLTEEYERIGTDAKSPLDGAWKQTQAYTVQNNDTTFNEVTEYKVYYAGHFVWGASYKDSTWKNYTGIGYGTFTMDGETQAKETVTKSTFSRLNGQTLDISITMNGKDEFQQTSEFTPGVKSVEVFQRLNKY